METLALLQHYWWLIISLLAGLLVFLLFVQGGQGLLYRIGHSDEERTLLVNALGHKWEFTFTTLVTFGGAMFAAFPLFYSTSFGGAYYLWFAILFIFVIQTVGYEFRSKAGNLLGKRTYEAFLMVNGIAAPLLLGVAVGGFFTANDFVVDRSAVASGGAISQWTSAWHGLEALWNPLCLVLGLAVCGLAQLLGALYFLNHIDNAEIRIRSRRLVRWTVPFFLLLFLAFLSLLLTSAGVDTATMQPAPYKYLHNLIEQPWLAALLLIGVGGVLWGLWAACFSGEPGSGKRCTGQEAIWPAGIGTVLTVVSLMLVAGWNSTAYYASSADPAMSLTIEGSSSSEFTLTAMSWVSLLIPFVAGYIWYTWRAMNRRPMKADEVNQDHDAY